MYAPDHGYTERELFMIYAESVIHWTYISPIEANPGNARLLWHTTQTQPLVRLGGDPRLMAATTMCSFSPT